jgi:hypothetical protein
MSWRKVSIVIVGETLPYRLFVASFSSDATAGKKVNTISGGFP